MKTRMKVPVNKFHDDNEAIFYLPKELGERNDYEHSTTKWFVNQWMDTLLDNFYVADKEIFGFAGDLKTVKFFLMDMIEEYMVRWNEKSIDLSAEQNSASEDSNESNQTINQSPVKWRKVPFL